MKLRPSLSPLSGGNLDLRVVEQPLDFTTLAAKYASFATDYAGGSGMKLRPSLSGTRPSRSRG